MNILGKYNYVGTYLFCTFFFETLLGSRATSCFWSVRWDSPVAPLTMDNWTTACNWRRWSRRKLRGGRWWHNKTLDVLHVTGKINPANIFTKEIRDGTHFCCLCDSFMSRLSDFLSTSLLTVHHARLQTPNQILPAAACVTLVNCASSYFTALALSSFCHTLTNISHLCSSGRQLLWGLHGFVPPCLI